MYINDGKPYLQLSHSPSHVVLSDHSSHHSTFLTLSLCVVAAKKTSFTCMHHSVHETNTTFFRTKANVTCASWKTQCSHLLWWKWYQGVPIGHSFINCHSNQLVSLQHIYAIQLQPLFFLHLQTMKKYFTWINYCWNIIFWRKWDHGNCNVWQCLGPLNTQS